MGQAKQRGTFEERVKQAKKIVGDTGDICTLLAIVKHNNKTVFRACGETIIPKYKGEFGSPKWEKKRNQWFCSLSHLKDYECTSDKQANEILLKVAHYLRFSPALYMAKNLPTPNDGIFCAHTGHRQTIDFDRLGCVFEYELETNPKSYTGYAINTKGPQWMTASDVIKEAKRLNIIREVA